MDSGYLNFKLVKPGLLKKLVYLEVTGSTNEYASANKLASDTLVITSNQTNGKGRFGRKWESSPGKNIAMTLVRNFLISIDEIHNVSFYSSLILLKTLEKLCKVYSAGFSLKWPNDVLLNGKKSAGFLFHAFDILHANHLGQVPLFLLQYLLGFECLNQIADVPNHELYPLNQNE